jgi:HSP20 family protein
MPLACRLRMASVFQPFQDVISELGRDFVFRPLSRAGGMASGAVTRIRLDVDEDDNAYTVRAEIPGARKEDIQVSVEGAQVSIGAEIRPETHGTAGQRTVYTERSYGLVSRTFTLPGEVDAQGAAAQYRDGVLTLVLPKKSALSGKRVPIS